MPCAKNREALEKLATLFSEFDDEVDAFTQAASLGCPSACGDCCDHADTEVSVGEARLIAEFLRSEDPGLIDRVKREARNEKRIACVFYNPENDLHCRIYPARPLICRSFGYSAYSDRTGNMLFAICPSMPIARRHGGVMQVLFEPFPPVVERYAERIAEIASRIAVDAGGDPRIVRKRPLSEAVYRELASLDSEGIVADRSESAKTEP